MSRRQPPPRTLAPEEERKIQRFLELAAPIVLESRVLDRGHWSRLTELARKLQLTKEQLRDTVEDLRQRGVIDKVVLSSPKPPPLPRLDPRSVEDKSPVSTSDREEEFSLTAPPPFQPPKAPPTPPQRSPQPRPAATVPTTDADRRRRFEQRARELVVAHRGMIGNAHPQLAAAAKELGISDELMHEIIRGQTRAASDDGDGETDRRRWRTEGEPLPEPPRAKKKPDETFRSYVARSLDKASRKQLTRESENAMVNHGFKVFRLAEVYARHIVLEVATDKGLTIESNQHVPAQQSATPQERQFCERAAPIVAQYRGINSKSRLLLTALGNELGMSAEQVEQAVASLQSRPTSHDTHSRRELRIGEFKKHLRAALAKLPRGVLLPNVTESLLEQGLDKYGIEPELVSTAILETAQDLKLSVISNQEAVQHIEGLVDEMLKGSVRLPSGSRDRLSSEAVQWGLTNDDVEKVVSQRTRQNYARRRAEQKWANVGLMGGAVAVLLVFGFIAWTLLDGIALEPPEVDRESDLTERVRAVEPAPDRNRKWWDRGLSVALADCRREFPAMRPILKELDSRDPQARAVAYERLVEELFVNTEKNAHRRLYLEAFSRCFALDPDDSAVDRLAAALLAVVPGPEDQLDDDPERYPNIFWGLRIAIAALAESAKTEEQRSETPIRVARLSDRISQGIGAAVDEQQSLRDLERNCLGALAERLFRLLLFSVETQPNLHRAIALEASKFLDPALIDQLNADYLVAVLDEAAGRWREYEQLIKQTILSVEPLAVATMVGLFQNTTSDELQGFMVSLLRQRTRVKSDKPVDELADEFLRSLGVRSDATAVGRHRKYTRLVASTIDAVRARADQPDLLLRETAGLARLATLGCALSRGDIAADAFQKLMDQGPAELPTSIRAAGGRGRVPSSADLNEIRGQLKKLSARNESDRRRQFASVVERADRLADIPAAEARKLAEYLVGLKPRAEYDAMLDRVDRLARWTNLQLAVADQIENSKLSVDQIRPVVERLLSPGAELTDGRPLDVKSLRVALLQNALHKVPAVESGSGDAVLLDAARNRLASEYSTQLGLLGVSRESTSAAAGTPSSLLTSLIMGHSELLRAGDLSDAQREHIEPIPYELDTIPYQARNDLEQTVLLERIWLRLLAVDVERRRPGLTQQAKTLLGELASKDSKAMNLVVQLRDGQQALARMWSLLNSQGGRL